MITSMDVYNLKSDREYLFRVTPRNKYGWGESTVSTNPVRTIQRTGLPQLHQQLYPQIKALVNTDIQLVCEVSNLIMIIMEFKNSPLKSNIRKIAYEITLRTGVF